MKREAVRSGGVVGVRWRERRGRRNGSVSSAVDSGGDDGVGFEELFILFFVRFDGKKK
jgi:hypothetical protein